MVATRLRNADCDLAFRAVGTRVGCGGGFGFGFRCGLWRWELWRWELWWCGSWRVRDMYLIAHAVHIDNASLIYCTQAVDGDVFEIIVQKVGEAGCWEDEAVDRLGARAELRRRTWAA
jgi:hypothetical protein